MLWLEKFSELTEHIQSFIEVAEGKISQEHAKIRVLAKQPAHVRLPWEDWADSENCELKDKIFRLSHDERNFKTAPEITAHIDFSFKDFVPVILKLFEMDSNLSAMHGKLCNKMPEESFWKNYYCRIIFLRAHLGMDGIEAKKRYSGYQESDFIYHPCSLFVEVSTESSVLSEGDKRLAVTQDYEKFVQICNTTRLDDRDYDFGYVTDDYEDLSAFDDLDNS